MKEVRKSEVTDVRKNKGRGVNEARKKLKVE